MYGSTVSKAVSVQRSFKNGLYTNNDASISSIIQTYNLVTQLVLAWILSRTWTDSTDLAQPVNTLQSPLEGYQVKIESMIGWMRQIQSWRNRSGRHIIGRIWHPRSSGNLSRSKKWSSSWVSKQLNSHNSTNYRINTRSHLAQRGSLLNYKDYLFSTLERVTKARSRVKSGVDFTGSIQEIIQLRVKGYEKYERNGHTIYLETGHFTI